MNYSETGLLPTFSAKGVIIGKMQWYVGYRCVNWEDGTVLSATHLNLIGLVYQLSGNDTSLKDLTTEEIELNNNERVNLNTSRQPPTIL